MSVYKNIFHKWVLCRSFETACAEAFRRKKIYSPIYLSLGTEQVAATLSEVFPDYKVFAQHRGHSYFLCYGGDPKELRSQILGKRGSASINLPNMFGHSGLLGDQVPISVGYADASKNNTLCVLGDAAAEEDYALGALGYAVTTKAPVLFICEDNNLSILTEKKVRRSWSISRVSEGFEIYSRDLEGCPFQMYSEFSLIKNVVGLPALLNIGVEREIWHSGAGSDGPPRLSRYEEFKTILTDHQIMEKQEIEILEDETLRKMWALWEL